MASDYRRHVQTAYRFLDRNNTGIELDVDGFLTYGDMEAVTGTRPRLDHQKLLQPGAAEAVQRLSNMFPTAFITGQTPEMLLPEVLPGEKLTYRFGYGVWRPDDTPKLNKIAQRVHKIWSYGQNRLFGTNIPALRMAGVGFAPLPTGATLFCDFRSPLLKERARVQILQTARYLRRFGIAHRDLDVAVEFFGRDTAPSKANAAVEWAQEEGLEAVFAGGDTASDAEIAAALRNIGVEVLFAAVGGRIGGDIAVANSEEMTFVLQGVADAFHL